MSGGAAPAGAGCKPSKLQNRQPSRDVTRVRRVRRATRASDRSRYAVVVLTCARARGGCAAACAMHASHRGSNYRFKFLDLDLSSSSSQSVVSARRRPERESGRESRPAAPDARARAIEASGLARGDVASTTTLGRYDARRGTASRPRRSPDPHPPLGSRDRQFEDPQSTWTILAPACPRRASPAALTVRSSL